MMFLKVQFGSKIEHRNPVQMSTDLFLNTYLVTIGIENSFDNIEYRDVYQDAENDIEATCLVQPTLDFGEWIEGVVKS